MSTTELPFLDATSQAELVRSKQATPLELVDAAIDRIERLNPHLNAVITPMFELGRSAAKKRLPDGPFRGVPFLLKDLLASYAGVPMASGSSFLRGFVPDHDSELVERYKRAGLVIIGKTNTPEFGLLPTTEPRAFGPSRNPWALGRISGGSSGGSAAAVAVGMAPMAHANDGGGSIRVPASCCGVFGMKPTRGRISLGPDFGDIMNGLVTEHAVTRTVRDSATLLDVTAGAAVGDPYQPSAPERPFLQEVGMNPGRLRIAFTTTAITGMPVHHDCVRAVHAAADLCSDLGHLVIEAAPDIDAEILVNSFTVVWSVGCASMVDRAAILTRQELAPERFEELTWEMIQHARRMTGPDYLAAVNVLQRTARQVGRFFTEFDVWLTPTLAEPPLPVGSFEVPGKPLFGFERAVAFAPFTPIGESGRR
jgi:amidase